MRGLAKHCTKLSFQGFLHLLGLQIKTVEDDIEMSLTCVVVGACSNSSTFTTYLPECGPAIL